MKRPFLFNDALGMVQITFELTSVQFLNKLRRVASEMALTEIAMWFTSHNHRKGMFVAMKGYENCFASP